MSDKVKHECGLALIRLKKPFSYYIEKYGSPTYALDKLYLLMEKQHNRGQDGAGVANVILNSKPGYPYIFRERSVKAQPIAAIFKGIYKKFSKAEKHYPKEYLNSNWLRYHVPFSGELLLGHLRYGTHGGNSIENCHPFIRKNNWRSRNLVVAGNFNMTNVDEQFDKLVSLGQHPKAKADTVTVLEKIGHFLDMENQRLFDIYNEQGYSNEEITELLSDNIDLQRVLQRACKDFDGGYVMAGLTGYGAAFVARDPAGIRPAYYYSDDEIVVVASEKPAIKTAFNVEYSAIKEVSPAHALIIQRNGEVGEYQFTDVLPKNSCSFERIYFSRGTDPDIYRERKELGRLLTDKILQAINYDLENTVFSYIPNTAETAFLGLTKGVERFLIEQRKKAIISGKLSHEEIDKILSFRPRVEKLVLKDAKMRTFITDDKHRESMVAHVYDTTYEVIRKRIDNIVVIDDSIVRGTTLEKSIISMLEKLEPKCIVVVSSAPQIRFPDCYGIDMSKMHDFVAFRAALALLKETKQQYLLEEVYHQCLESMKLETHKIQNHVKEIYAPFTHEQISDKVAEIVKPKHVQAEVKVVFQTVENLHLACPNHSGDWYFTGNYPTVGGNRIVNKAFINFMEGKKDRAYN
jgi:amidophosphoribosyltransferase